MIALGPQLIGPTEKTLNALLHDTTYAPDTAEVVDSLIARGLVRDDRLSASGRDAVARIEHRIEELTSGIWEAVYPADRVAAERALNTVLDRARAVLVSR